MEPRGWRMQKSSAKDPLVITAAVLGTFFGSALGVWIGRRWGR